MADLPPPPIGVPEPGNPQEEDDDDEDMEDEEERVQRLKEEAYVRALNRCGISGAPLLDYLRVQHGQVTVDSLASLNDTEINTMVLTVNKTPNPAVPRRGGATFFIINAVAQKRLKSFREWIKWRQAMRLNTDADEFTHQWMQWSLDRMDFETRNAKATSESVPLPEALKSTGHKYWIPFWRQFKNYCHTIRGSLNIPVIYVFRDMIAPEVDIFNIDYTTSDEALMDCVALHGTYYNEDNARVWAILEGLTCNGNAYPFIKRFARKRDGRGAILALKSQCEGSAAVATRKTVAYNIIKTTTYDGKGSRYTFESYVEKLQFAFSELEECGDPQSESHKIHVLCTQCTSPIMQSGCDKVQDEPFTYTTFAEASEFLQGNNARKAAKNMSSVDRRGISYTETEPDDGSDLQEKYTPVEWKRLSQATRDRVIQRNRNRKTTGESGTSHGPAKTAPRRRSVKKVKSTAVGNSEPESNNSSDSDATPKTRKVSAVKNDDKEQ